MVRGRQVRKQAAVTLRCMQALVRVQARVRARRVRMSIEGQAVQKMLEEHRGKLDCLKEAEVSNSDFHVANDIKVQQVSSSFGNCRKDGVTVKEHLKRLKLRYK